MERIEFDNVTVEVIIQAIGGDLRLRGRPGERLQVDGEGATVEQVNPKQPYLVRSSGDARITVPDDVDVTVQTVGGDAKITELGGKTEIQAIGGDLALRGVGDVQIKMVGGDLRLKRAEGNVIVETVGGDATIRDITGTVWVAAVGADLYLRSVEGDCVIENVGSDLVLNVDFQPGRDYRFSAGSDILCRVQDDTNAKLILPADTELNLDVQAQVTEDADGLQTVTLGEGAATVYIQNADRVRLVGEEEEFMINFGVQIEEELEARLSTLEEKLSQQLEGLDERIQARATQWASQAERAAELAQRQAERALERVRRNMERGSRKTRRSPGPRRINLSMRGSERAPDKDPVTEEERMLILKMVQENKITIEEAERLLAALES